MINKQYMYPAFCSDICPRTLPVPRSEQFSKSNTRDLLKTGEYHSDIPQVWLGHVQSRDAFRPITCEGKYLMD